MLGVRGARDEGFSRMATDEKPEAGTGRIQQGSPEEKHSVQFSGEATVAQDENMVEIISVSGGDVMISGPSTHSNRQNSEAETATDDRAKQNQNILPQTCSSSETLVVR